MDDPINVHGTSVRIIERPAHDRLVCRFMHEQSTGMTWGHPGDRVGLHRARVDAHRRRGRVVAASGAIDRDTFEVRFEKPAPAEVGAGDALENLTWSPDVTIRDNDFESNRARGLLVSTPGRVLIENNRFQSSGSAILIAGDANDWYESGAVRDVTIRGNVFGEACLSSPYQFGEGIISILPGDPEAGPRAIRSTATSGSRTTSSVPPIIPVLYAKSVDGLTFSGNRTRAQPLLRPVPSPQGDAHVRDVPRSPRGTEPGGRGRARQEHRAEGHAAGRAHVGPGQDWVR